MSIKNSFKKAFCTTLSVLMLFAGLTAFTSVSAEFDVSKLQNTYAKIMAGETINIAYYGGSVTNGYAGGGQDCQSNGKSWRARTFKWFQDTFADTGATFVENHAALGGTGSNMNLYRANEALKFGTENAPDLIFIEFAINDSYEGLTYEQSAEYMEGIVRKLYLNDPYTDIVIVLTTDSGKRDTEFANAKGHADIAAAYDIPCVWLGKEMWPFLTEQNGGTPVTNFNAAPWTTYYADGCHPNEFGHEKYTEFILDDALIPNLTADGLNLNAATRVAKVMPEPIYNNGRYVESYGITAGKCGFSGYGFGSNGSKLYANTPGASFNVTFYGTGFGFKYAGSASNGIIEYNVDGGSYSSKNLYTSGSGNEHTMLVSGLEKGNHTVNLIFRKSLTGSYLELHQFFVDGDPDMTPFSFGTPPTSAPIDDPFIASITLAPAELKTYVAGTVNGTYIQNDGAELIVEESMIDDVDTLNYIPNTDSDYIITSDCYNAKLKSVTVPSYNYITIGYHYKVASGLTPTAQHMDLRLLQLPLTPSSITLSPANALKVNESDEAIIDITVLSAKGMESNLKQFHFSPFGANVKGSDAQDGEIMYIKDMTFHASYPYDESPKAVDLSAAVAEGGTSVSSEKDGIPAYRITSSGAVSLSLADISAMQMLPSVYKYAQLEYYCESGAGATPALTFPTLDNGEYTTTPTSALVSGKWAKATFALGDIADVKGQWSYFKDMVMKPFGAESTTGGDIYVKSLTFYSAYPDSNAEFAVSFDLNGGIGTAPADVVAKIGTSVTLPTCGAVKDGFVFAGWATTPNGTFLSKYYMPENGATLYAVWAEAQTLFVSATDTSITYKGIENTVGYTSLASALTALGKNGGTVVMTGEQAATALTSITSGALTVRIIGANETAKITEFNSNYNLKSPLYLENLTFVKSSGNPHFFSQGYKLTIGEGCNLYSGTTLSRFEIVNGNSGTKNSVLEISSGTYGCISATFGAPFTGNNTYIFNGGTFQNAVDLGLRSAASEQFKGNANLIINGGTFQNKNIVCTGYSEGSGARTAIFNNSTYNSTFTIDFDYIIDSAAGGSVSISKQATANTAPELTLTALKSTYDISVDGVKVGTGTYVLKPTEKKLYTVTYAVPTFTVSFDANGGEGTVPTPVTNVDGTEINLSAPTDITYAGRFFMGWSDSKNAAQPITSYTINGKNAVLYAVWSNENTYFVNPDGSGKLTIGGIEHTAFTTMLEAANAMTNVGGTIIFTGTVGTGDANQFTSALSKVTNGKVIIKGAERNAASQYKHEVMGVNLYCDMEFRNLSIVKTTNDWYTWCKGHKLTLGEYGVENDVKIIDSTGNATSIKLLGADGGATANTNIVVNSGNINGGNTCGGAYGGNLNGNVLLTVNGGTFASNVNGGILAFNSTVYTISGNSTVIISGGSFNSPKIVFNSCNVNGKKTAVFNNDMYDLLSFNAEAADRIIISSEGCLVSELVSGTSYLVTPSSLKYVPYVNGEALAKNADNKYVFTPTADGTFRITYTALSDVTIIEENTGAKLYANGKLEVTVNADGETLFNKYTDDITEISISSESIPAGAFTGSEALKTIRVSSDVKSIGAGALVNSEATLYFSPEATEVKEYAVDNGLRYSLFGDTNGDTKVSLSDMARFMRHIDGSSEPLADSIAADINGDGLPDYTDLVSLMKYIAGSKKSLG